MSVRLFIAPACYRRTINNRDHFDSDSCNYAREIRKENGPSHRAQLVPNHVGALVGQGLHIRLHLCLSPHYVSVR
jgi:hypothetical protein